MDTNAVYRSCGSYKGRPTTLSSIRPPSSASQRLWAFSRFNPKMNRSLVFDLATGAFINKREDALFLGPGGTGKSHLAQAIGQAAIQQG